MKKIKNTLPLEVRKKLGFIEVQNLIHSKYFNYKILNQKRKKDASLNLREN